MGCIKVLKKSGSCFCYGLLLQLHTDLMLRHYFLFCTWDRGGGVGRIDVLKKRCFCFCYVTRCSLALARRLDATSLDAHWLDATLLHFLLHLRTGLMLCY